MPSMIVRTVRPRDIVGPARVNCINSKTLSLPNYWERAMRYRILSLGALAVMVCAVAQGRECSGVSFSEQLQSEAGPLVLNGLGMRQATVFKVDVYVGALYLTKPSTDAKA